MIDEEKIMIKNLKCASNDMSEILQMRIAKDKKDRVQPRDFKLEYKFELKEIFGDNNKINVVMIINIIPNSFVLSYLAVLKCILSTYFMSTLDKMATINVLFMEEAVISENGAWKSIFSEHYSKILNDVDADENLRRNLIYLKRAEFESFLNMVLLSFNDLNIKKNIRNRKITLNFDGLSKHREKLGISEGNEKTEDIRKKFEENDELKLITDVQKEMFTQGNDRAVIVEMGRLLNYWINPIIEEKDGKLIFIAAELFKNAMKGYYSDNLYKDLEKNMIWFNDPPIRNNKMLMYLNPLSKYINEDKDIKYIELEEFYHYKVLKNLESKLFKHNLYKMQNNISHMEYEEYHNQIKHNHTHNGKDLISEFERLKNSDLDIDQRGTLLTYLNKFSDFNILQLRSHQMKVINKGFLSVQNEIIKQLELIL